MVTLKTYNEDLQIARALLDRDERVTRNFFYKQCYPLFKSVYDNFYTDCEGCKEFIDEIYLLIVSPSKQSGKCQLENYRGESSLMTWLKTTCLFYCYKKFDKKNRMLQYETIITSCNEKQDDDDSFLSRFGSIEMDSSNINRIDVYKILDQMPNARYRMLIKLRYIEELTNEETANRLGMNMDNFYNKNRLAKKQFLQVLRNEEKI